MVSQQCKGVPEEVLLLGAAWIAGSWHWISCEHGRSCILEKPCLLHGPTKEKLEQEESPTSSCNVSLTPSAESITSCTLTKGKQRVHLPFWRKGKKVNWDGEATNCLKTLLAMPQGMWDLSSMTGCPCIGSVEFLTTYHQKSLTHWLLITYFWLCWAFTAMHWRSLVVVSGHYSSVRYVSFTAVSSLAAERGLLFRLQ